MAFVGFWMIPLAIIFLVIDKFLEFFGFDLSAWLSEPGNIEKAVETIIDIIEFLGSLYSTVQMYVTLILDFIRDIFSFT